MGQRYLEQFVGNHAIRTVVRADDFYLDQGVSNAFIQSETSGAIAATATSSERLKRGETTKLLNMLPTEAYALHPILTQNLTNLSQSVAAGREYESFVTKTVWCVIEAFLCMDPALSLKET